MVNKLRILNDLESLLKERKYSKNKIDLIMARVKILKNHIQAIKNCDAITILTEWDEFKNYEWDKILNKPSNIILFDGRNITSKANYSIGK